jgi:hypothetical protein
MQLCVALAVGQLDGGNGRCNRHDPELPHLYILVTGAGQRMSHPGLSIRRDELTLYLRS